MNIGCFMDESYEVETEHEDRMLYNESLSLALQHLGGVRYILGVYHGSTIPRHSLRLMAIHKTN